MVEHFVDMHLEGKPYGLDVPIGPVDDEQGLEAIEKDFPTKHRGACRLSQSAGCPFCPAAQHLARCCLGRGRRVRCHPNGDNDG